MKIRTLREVVVRAVNGWSADNASTLAAALSFYTFFSLAPLLVIIINLAGIIFGQQAVQSNVMDQVRGLLGAGGAQTVQELMTKAQQPGRGTVSTLISAGTLLVGAVAVFTQLQVALNIIFQAPQQVGGGLWKLARQYVLSFGIVVSTGFLLLVSLTVSSLLAAFSAYVSALLPGIGILWKAADLAVSFAIIAVLFALMYKVLPNKVIPWKDTVVGALVTSFLFSVGKFAIGLYLGKADLGGTYGTAASLVIILLWVYYSSQILFFGAEFTKAYAQARGISPLPVK